MVWLDSSLNTTGKATAKATSKGKIEGVFLLKILVHRYTEIQYKCVLALTKYEIPVDRLGFYYHRGMGRRLVADGRGNRTS